MDDRVIPGVMNDVLLPQGRYPENFMLISEWGGVSGREGQEGGTWRTLMVPDQRHG